MAWRRDCRASSPKLNLVVGANNARQALVARTKGPVALAENVEMRSLILSCFAHSFSRVLAEASFSPFAVAFATAFADALSRFSRLSLHWIRAWRWPSDLTFALVSFLFCFSLCVRLCALSSFSFLATPFLLCGLARAARRRRTRLCRRRACRSTCRVFVVLGSAPTLTAYFLLLRCRGGSVPGGMATRVPLLPRQAVNAPVRIPNRSAQCGANRYSGVSLSCFLQVIEKHSQHSLAGKTRVQAKPKDVERQASSERRGSQSQCVRSSVFNVL